MPYSAQTSVSRRLTVALATALTLGAASAAARADDAKVPQNDLLNATLWMQKSVEYKATVSGIYDLARIRLDQALADKSWTAMPDTQGDDYKAKPVAIIADLDETALDNNVYEASLVTRNTGYSSKEWDQYVKAEKAGAMPGAVDFFKYAASKGVEVFYVSNRDEGQEEATREDLKKLGFPLDEKVDTVLAKGEKPEWKSAKDNRHDVIAKDYRVVMLLGDNMGDFTDKADGSVDERAAAYKADADHWGHDWIMFPNPEYGSWESASFGGDWSKSPDQRRKDKIDRLDTWSPPN